MLVLRLAVLSALAVTDSSSYASRTALRHHHANTQLHNRPSSFPSPRVVRMAVDMPDVSRYSPAARERFPALKYQIARLLSEPPIKEKLASISRTDGNRSRQYRLRDDIFAWCLTIENGWLSLEKVSGHFRDDLICAVAPTLGVAAPLARTFARLYECDDAVVEYPAGSESIPELMYQFGELHGATLQQQIDAMLREPSVQEALDRLAWSGPNDLGPQGPPLPLGKNGQLMTSVERDDFISGGLRDDLVAWCLKEELGSLEEVCSGSWQPEFCALAPYLFLRVNLELALVRMCERDHRLKFGDALVFTVGGPDEFCDFSPSKKESKKVRHVCGPKMFETLLRNRYPAGLHLNTFESRHDNMDEYIGEWEEMERGEAYLKRSRWATYLP